LGAGYAYAFTDLAPAYNSAHFHGGTLNRPKVRTVSRQLVYLRGLDSVVVYDRVSTTDPSFRTTWLLHSLGDLEVVGGTETRLDEGESSYSGASRAILRHGWPKPVPSFGRALSVTLLPEQPRFLRIGGRIDLPPGQTEGFPGDQWHGQHRHRHLKDFWVAGTNYPPGNPPETRWFGEAGSQWYVPGTPDESGGRGQWRLEVSPAGVGLDHKFLHVLCPRLGAQGEFPEVSRMSVEAFHGAVIREGGRNAAVFFCAEEATRPGLTVALPEGIWEVLIADLLPGNYRLSWEGASATAQVDESGLLHAPNARGRLRVARD
jgi:hypothetical protein